jgi:DUF1365 family protein
MLSRFYVGKVAHHRGEPFHGFDYRVCYAWIDLDEIDEFCASSSLISQERINLFSYYREDYLPGEAKKLVCLIQAKCSRSQLCGNWVSA